MSWFDWIFGRRDKTPHPREDEPLPPMRLAPAASSSRPSYVQQPQPAPLPPTKHQRIPDTFEYVVEYSTGGDPPRPRNVVFLLASPGAMITGIDLTKRRIRTYRFDRILSVTNPRTGVTLTAPDFFAAEKVVDLTAWNDTDASREMAMIMLKEMICQISVAVLMAQAGQGMTAKNLDAIMTYVQRDTRFAVRADFVPKGSKADVWPVLRDRIFTLKPRREYIAAYVETLNDSWENPRRLAALNDALTALCYFEGGPTEAQRRLGIEINNAVGR